MTRQLEIIVYQQRKTTKRGNTLRKKIKEGFERIKLKRIAFYKFEKFRLKFSILSSVTELVKDKTRKLTSYPASSRRTTACAWALRASRSSCSEREPVLGRTRTRFTSSSSSSSSSSEAEYMWRPSGALVLNSSSEEEYGNQS